MLNYILKIEKKSSTNVVHSIVHKPNSVLAIIQAHNQWGDIGIMKEVTVLNCVGVNQSRCENYILLSVKFNKRKIINSYLLIGQT